MSFLCGIVSILFLELLKKQSDSIKLTNFVFRTLGGSLDENCYCYTLEVSFFSYQPVGFSHPIPYTEEEYMKLGRNLARTFLDYYKLQNHIIFNPTTAIAPKLTNQNFLKSSNTSQNLQSFNSANSNNGTASSICTNGSSAKNNSASVDASSNYQASAKQVSTSRSSKSINQTLKPLSSMSLSGNSSSSLNNGKDSNNNNSNSNTPNLGSQATADNNGVSTAVTFSLN